MTATPPVDGDALQSAIRERGHALLPGAELRPLLLAHGELGDWEAFADSWQRLKLDTYMADGGRYRRRRYAVYAVERGGRALRSVHEPHYQSRDYNPLNGGIARWFEPIEDAVGDSASLRAVLAFGSALFDALAPQVARWHIELHQFRIEAAAGGAGQPTPEGVHRDGVDYALVLLVRRHNIASGTTTIYDPQQNPLGSFTLTQPLDATLLDDARVYHGVTPVTPLDPAQPAYRDVLVATWRRA